MISEAFRGSYIESSIRRQATRNSPGVCKGCCTRSQWHWIRHGVWITGLGPCCGTSIPHAEIPVVQLSIDEARPAEFHFEVGRKLALLRNEGILIIGSGNVVHNLHAYACGRHVPDPYDWAIRFEQRAKELMLSGEDRPLIAYETLAARPCSRFRHRTTTCPCFTCSGRASKMIGSRFRLKGSMADQFPC